MPVRREFTSSHRVLRDAEPRGRCVPRRRSVPQVACDECTVVARRRGRPGWQRRLVRASVAGRAGRAGLAVRAARAENGVSVASAERSGRGKPPPFRPRARLMRLNRSNPVRPWLPGNRAGVRAAIFCRVIDCARQPVATGRGNRADAMAAAIVRALKHMARLRFRRSLRFQSSPTRTCRWPTAV
jgi:hypothetical protein